MNIKTTLIAATAILALSGCKTTEQNYRNAYSIAKEKETLSIDPETQARIDEENRGMKTTINGEEVRMKTERVRIVEPAEGAVKPAFGVVVATFKQVFNAKMFRKRLMEQNYPALVVINHDGEHHVVIKGFDTDAQAAAFLKDLVKKGEVKTPIEPFILAMP